MKYFTIMYAAFLCGVSANPHKINGPQCQAPNGGGIIPVIKEFIGLIPLDEMLAIYMNAVSNDTEVQAVIAYLESDDFHETITAIIGSKEFNKIGKIACGELYLDIIYYGNLFNKVLGLPIIQRPLHMRKSLLRRPGINGMLFDIIDLIDFDVVEEWFIKKSRTDNYIIKAVQIIQSQNFKNIFETLYKTPPYSKLLNDLRGLGVNIDGISNLINKFLGW